MRNSGAGVVHRQLVDGEVKVRAREFRGRVAGCQRAAAPLREQQRAAAQALYESTSREHG